MATKTISIDLEAYERLRRARRARNESFSQVIKRAHWPPPPRSAAALLEALDHLPVMDEAVLDQLAENQERDAHPSSRWPADRRSTRQS